MADTLMCECTAFHNPPTVCDLQNAVKVNLNPKYFTDRERDTKLVPMCAIYSLYIMGHSHSNFLTLCGHFKPLSPICYTFSVKFVGCPSYFLH